MENGLKTSNGSKKRKRKKKRTKTQEAQRLKLINQILNKWVCISYYGDNGNSYIFMKHIIPEGGTHSKIEQVILSGDPLYDGVYAVNDYEISSVLDKKTDKEILELRPKKYDLKVGLYSEDVIVEDYQSLKIYLKEHHNISDAEFHLYSQSKIKPKDVIEIRLSYDSFDDEKE